MRCFGLLLMKGHLQRTIKISPQDAIAKSERTDGYRDTFTDDEWRILTVNLYNYAHRRGQYAGKRVNACLVEVGLGVVDGR